MATAALATYFTNPVKTGVTGKYGVPGGLATDPTAIHLGVDFGGSWGASISAAANGTVVGTGLSHKSFGKYVILEHVLTDNTKVYTLYAHLSSVSVSKGQTLHMGDKVGGMGGSAGTDPDFYPTHLHFEVSYKNSFTSTGQYGGGYDSPSQFTETKKFTVDPLAFIKAHPVTNTQNGTASADVLWGESSSERMDGRGGNDEIRGNLGNDTITGGEGRDSLYGGSGNDTFDFNFTSESRAGLSLRDKIYDFSPGSDKIDLSTIDANTLLSGNQVFKYIGTSSFHHYPGGLSAGELRMSGGILSGDTNGDGVSDFEVQVTSESSSINSLAASSFLL